MAVVVVVVVVVSGGTTTVYKPLQVVVSKKAAVSVAVSKTLKKPAPVDSALSYAAQRQSRTGAAELFRSPFAISNDVRHLVHSHPPMSSLRLPPSSRPTSCRLPAAHAPNLKLLSFDRSTLVSTPYQHAVNALHAHPLLYLHHT
jgi:hypothetical protein